MQKLNLSAPMLYKDKHGADKTKWVNIGSLVINDEGKVFGNIDAVPTGDWDGSFSAFDRENKNSSHNPQQAPMQNNYNNQAPQGGYAQPNPNDVNYQQAQPPFGQGQRS